MNYHITGLYHWEKMKRLHAMFYTDKTGLMWPALLMEVISTEMKKQVGIPACRF